MNIKRQKLFSKQRGATLFTSLVFLILMTIVSVSATKIAMLDVLISGNNQQQMLLFQSTENDLKELTTVVQLYAPLINDPVSAKFNELTGIYELDLDSNKPHITQQITDKEKTYQCGGFAGQAISIGPNVPSCDLYDFQVKSRQQNTGVRDRHNRGAGKEKPNPNKNSYL